MSIYLVQRITDGAWRELSPDAPCKAVGQHVLDRRVSAPRLLAARPGRGAPGRLLPRASAVPANRRCFFGCLAKLLDSFFNNYS
ncbi:hypothetical protein B5X24_HaOG206106 [Helicoverpa armigera]|uniref:Uncharacterized protein n=1 Tax=Helicoverpa armigera TaxID=29058 RepID=A0A2W1BQP6_HELAM|nr:hypothetical protein B5X24_HaOG206106 [Helicoverpa armigera]